MRNRIAEDALDVSLLMWFLRLGLDRDRFPAGRTVVRFDYTDQPRLAKGKWWLDRWWLIVTDDGIDLCIDDPGFEADLFVLSDLRTMTKVSMGDMSVREALRSGAIELHGSRKLAERFEAWLPRSGFAEVTRPPDPLDLRAVLGSTRIGAA